MISTMDDRRQTMRCRLTAIVYPLIFRTAYFDGSRERRSTTRTIIERNRVMIR